MNQKNKRPAAGPTAGRAKGSNDQRTPYTQTKPPAKDIWDACREVVDAEAKRKARADAKVKAAALAIGFSQNAGLDWVRQCPHCGRKVVLYINNYDDIHAAGNGAGGSVHCSAIQPINQWLRKEGYQP